MSRHGYRPVAKNNSRNFWKFFLKFLEIVLYYSKDRCRRGDPATPVQVTKTARSPGQKGLY